MAAMAALLATVLGAGWSLGRRGCARPERRPCRPWSSPSAFAAALGGASRGARLGWLAVAGLGLPGHRRGGPDAGSPSSPNACGWPVHALTAVAGIGYVGAMAAALWMRYSYLIDLREAMGTAPATTRSPGCARTRRPAPWSATRSRVPPATHPLGVIVVSIANLYGAGAAAWPRGLQPWPVHLRQPAAAHACRPAWSWAAGRGRLPAAAAQSGTAAAAWASWPTCWRERLARPVALGTSRDMAALEGSRTELGGRRRRRRAGRARPTCAPPVAVAGARAMSRTAWSYASRVAWYDEDSRQIAELPLAADGWPPRRIITGSAAARRRR